MSQIQELISGDQNLYNPLFCDLLTTTSTDGFVTCDNCDFGNQTKFGASITKSNASECLKACNSEPHCTSYRFDNSKNKDNCDQYISFPSSINKNVNNINSGYSTTKFKYNYETLNPSQKNNVKQKCMSQYLNNTAQPGKDIDLSKCFTISSDYRSGGQYHPYSNWACMTRGHCGRSWTEPTINDTVLHFDEKCIYDTYKANGIDVGLKNTSIYIDNPDHQEYTRSTRDQTIDNYQQSYKTYTDSQHQITDINNRLSSDDRDFPGYNNTVNTNNSSLQTNYNNSIKGYGDNLKVRTKDIVDKIGIIENFDNENNIMMCSNNIKMLVLLVILLLLFAIIFLIRKK